MLGMAHREVRQQVYDHRLRDLVRQTGDIGIATATGVPRTTAAGWLRRIGESIAEGRTLRALDDRPTARGGAILVRTWREKSYTVTVSDKGHVLEGVTYRSLSEVARKITGTRWNGPQFFGLRSAKGIKSAERIRGE